ncbi:hypothetical protein C8Q80DRAFT_1341464 [Daedaleopsis nitida]|nr:hypothetical protein C8Q80DRAFT_1341464 [Daedaleopsis nitida]
MTSKTQGVSPKKGPAFNVFSTGTVPVAEKRRNIRLTTLRKMAGISYDYLMSDIISYTGYIPDDSYFAGMFDDVPVDGVESKMYDPLTESANKGDLLNNKFKLVTTPNKPDPSDPTKQKMDCAMYANDNAPLQNGRANWRKVELSIEVKPKDFQDDPFNDNWPHYPKSSEKRQDNLGQIMTYSILVFDNQNRTHHFTVVIFGTMARIVFWDRSSVIFTEKFNYKAEPHKLGKFLWCYSRLSPAQRGHDTTVVPVLPGSYEHELMLRRAAEPLVVDKNVVGEHARKAFKASVDNKAPCFKLTVPDATGEKTFLVGKPNFIASGLVGRGTRGYVAIDMADEDGPFVYLKDCWRVEHERIRKEGDVLEELNAAEVPHIPTLLCHGDIPGQRTRGPETFKKVYGDEKKCYLKSHQHYRMVVKEVGMPLTEFKNGQELVRVLLDCLEAHAAAYAAGLIHRDISAGNILIYYNDADGTVEGVLADWELSKKVKDDSDEPRQPDRTGTWQFMSVRALNDSRKIIMIPDELESFFHVLLFIALHFMPHNCDNVSEFVSSFFDSAQQRDLDFFCGDKKQSAMKFGQLVNKDEVAIYFLREPIKPIAKVEREPPLDIDPTSQSSTTDVDTTADVVEQTAATSSVEQDVFGPAAPRPSLFPREALHPIHLIIRELLPLFVAYYRIYAPTAVPAGQTPTVAVPNSKDVAKYQALWGKPTPQESDQSAIPPEVREKGALLNTHTAFGSILYRHLVKDIWPENDKQPDQVDPKYSKKEYYVLKRSRLHDDEFEIPSGKRAATGEVAVPRT